MPAVPAFFVPEAAPGGQEDTYADFAKWCGQSVPEIALRIYSITFIHDEEEWTATVGETLHGMGRPKRGRRSATSERTVSLSDPAMVLAIFPGNPYFVVTNHRINRNLRSAWESPFMAGRPNSVTYFSRPSGAAG